MTCFSLIRGRVLRATKVDSCGAPVLGATSKVVSKGFISVQFTANTEEGEAISVTNANGDICVQDTPAPRFVNYALEIAFCGVDPNLINLMTGNPLVYDGSVTPEAVGFRVNSGLDLDAQGFALELWSSVPAAACVDGQASYGYFLSPFVKGGIIGDFTIENAAVNFTLTGATTRDGSGWGVGPYDVVDDAGTPSPLLTAIDDKDHLHVQITTIAPPVDECGATEVGVEATGATAGIPATLTPSNSYPPADFAALLADPLTATPGTAWTTGQYVELGDGSHAHWDGSAPWVAGDAP
jgi:hypothetical protein